MADVQEEQTTVTRTSATPTTNATTTTTVAGPPRAIQVVYLILGIVEILLAFRLVLRLLLANSANAFVDLIYSITYPLITPFIGIFTLPDKGIASFELATLVAIVVYAVLGYIIVAAVGIATRPRTTA